jgi:ABC-type bacteriocin/lantibiotic exporter with double-glycine peptidase domain
MMLPGDGAAVKGAKVQRASLRRVWIFSSPYRTDIIVFLTAICVSALLALAPPLLFRAILDRAIPQARPDPFTPKPPPGQPMRAS